MMEKGLWKKYTAKKLEENVIKDPLTIGKIKQTLQTKINELRFYGGMYASCIIPVGNRRYSIFISTKDSPEKQKIKMIHTIDHAYREVSVYSDESDKPSCRIEEIIENDAQKFCKYNKNFVDTLYKSLIKRK